MHLSRLVAVCALAALLSGPVAAQQEWGHIKGQVTFGGNPPKLDPKKVDKDQQHCLSRGPIPDETWVVNPRNKGVRWIVVWLAVDKNGTADHAAVPPIHPSLARPAKKEVQMDQPCCKFEPHVAVVRKGQDFVGTNSSPIAHNMNLTSIRGPNQNQVLPPGGKMTVGAAQWRPHHLPVRVSCNIHPWMGGYVFCIAHPYFAVTDEDGKFEIKNVPAGKYRMIAWHDEGFALGVPGQNPTRDGMPIEIKANAVNNVNFTINKR
jgi:hypothetical protein